MRFLPYSSRSRPYPTTNWSSICFPIYWAFIGTALLYGLSKRVIISIDRGLELCNLSFKNPVILIISNIPNESNTPNVTNIPDGTKIPNSG